MGIHHIKVNLELLLFIMFSSICTEHSPYGAPPIDDKSNSNNIDQHQSCFIKPASKVIGFRFTSMLVKKKNSCKRQAGVLGPAQWVCAAVCSQHFPVLYWERSPRW